MIPRLTDEEIEEIYLYLSITGYGVDVDSSNRGLQRIQIEFQMRILDSIEKLKDERK